MNRMLGSSRGLLLIGGGAMLVAGMFLALRGGPTAPPVMQPLVPVAEPAAPVLPQYVVATRDISRGTKVDAEALRLVGMSQAPAADAPRTLDEVIGRVAIDRIAAGQVVLKDSISANQAAAGLGVLVPTGTRAVTLKVLEDTGINGLLRPGDHVDIMIATQEDPQGNVGKSSTPDIARFALENVTVLAVGEMLDPVEKVDPQKQNQNRGRDALRPITLAVTPEQALTLSLARGDGNYILALRNVDDQTIASLPRTTREQLISDGTPTAAPVPAPQRPVVARPAAPSGPVIIRGASGASR